MKLLAGTESGQSDPFAPTHWSLILAAAQSQTPPEIAEAALAQLCQTYWAPLYHFVRSRGHPLHDAEDLTQSFFGHLIEHKIYARADREKGKFRSFLLASLQNFLANAYRCEQAQKRGGGRDFLPLNESQIEAAELLFQTHLAPLDSPNEDRVFEQSWAEALVDAALTRLSAEYAAEGKKELFETLKVFLTANADPLPTYDQLAEQLGIPSSTLRSHVTRLRTRYRAALRAEVRRTVESDAEVDGELRELLRVLTER